MPAGLLCTQAALAAEVKKIHSHRNSPAEKRTKKMFGDLSQQTFDLLNKADMSSLNKTTISQATISGVAGNLNAFDLRGPALQLYPVITPLRNRLPRQLSDRGDLATRWKAITGVNTSGFELGVAPGRRSAEMAVTEQDYVASYAGIGLEASIDWEAVWSGGKEFDNKATLVQSLLRAVMIGEENIILNGNASMPIGPVTAPTLSAGTNSGGFPTSGTNVFVGVSALTARALANSSVTGGVAYGNVTRVNIDGSTTAYGAGASAITALVSFTTTAANQQVNATVQAVKGAAGYAWYVGTSAGTATLLRLPPLIKPPSPPPALAARTPPPASVPWMALPTRLSSMASLLRLLSRAQVISPRSMATPLPPIKPTASLRSTRLCSGSGTTSVSVPRKSG